MSVDPATGTVAATASNQKHSNLDRVQKTFLNRMVGVHLVQLTTTTESLVESTTESSLKM